MYSRKGRDKCHPTNDMSADKHDDTTIEAITERVGAWLKAARQRAGLTQHQASDLSGVHFGVVTRCEGGRDLMASNFLRLVWLYGADVGLAELLEAITTAQHRLRAVAEPSAAYEIRARVLKSTDPLPTSRAGAANAEVSEKVNRRRRA